MNKAASNKAVLVHVLGYPWPTARMDMARLSNIMAPMGMLSIAAWLEKKGVPTAVIDAYAHPRTTAQLVKDTLAHEPTVVGVGVTTAIFNDAVRFARALKEAAPNVTIVFGGVHASATRERVLADNPAIDFSVVGEGEEALFEVVERGREAPETIEGLIWRDAAGQVVYNGPRATLLELDDLPFPAYEKLQGFPAAYPLPIFSYPRAPHTSCVSSRGCPYQCSYCDRSVFRRSFRFNSAEYLYEHLAHLKRRFGIRHVNLYDDQFTLNRERVAQFCELMRRRPLGMTFNCAVRANHVDLELLRAMKSAGCWMVSLGIETGDPELLAQHRQGVSLEQAAQVVHWIKQARMRAKGLFIMGLPGETEESIRRSRDYVLSLPLDEMNLAKFTPFPGSPIYEGIREQGEFDEDWDRMDCMNFQFVPKGMTREQLEKRYNEFLLAYYKRPSMLFKYMLAPLRSPHSVYRFIKDFGTFWRYRNYMLDTVSDKPKEVDRGA